MFAVDNGPGHLPEGKAHIPGHDIDAHPHGHQHHGGLEHIGPHDGLDPCLVGIGPDQCDGDHHGKHKGDVPVLEQGQVQHARHHEEPEGGADGLGEQEEEGAGLMGNLPETAMQVRVDGDQLQPVVEGKQDVGDDEIAHQVAQHQLEVVEMGVPHLAGHGDKGDARERGTNHSEGHHVPGRLPVPGKVGIQGGPAGGDAGDQEQNRKINDNDCQN